jgi:rod shape-determining protein MreD
MNPARGGWVILLTIIVAMVLSVVQLPPDAPHWLTWARPNWLVLVVFYWVMAVPHRIGLIAAWVIGLLVDVLHGELLGLNAFTLAALTYVTWSLYERLRMYTIVQQAFVLLLLATAAEIARHLVHVLTLDVDVTVAIAGPALVTALIWPAGYLILRWIRRHLGVR